MQLESDALQGVLTFESVSETIECVFCTSLAAIGSKNNLNG